MVRKPWKLGVEGLPWSYEEWLKWRLLNLGCFRLVFQLALPNGILLFAGHHPAQPLRNLVNSAWMFHSLWATAPRRVASALQMCRRLSPRPKCYNKVKRDQFAFIADSGLPLGSSGPSGITHQWRRKGEVAQMDLSSIPTLTSAKWSSFLFSSSFLTYIMHHFPAI